jgi:exodeoxyribonuclease V beta subunit
MVDELVAHIPVILSTPLHAERDGAVTLPNNFSLGQLHRTDRLDELPFDLRLGSGTAHRQGAGLLDEGQHADAEEVVAALGLLGGDHRSALRDWAAHRLQAATHGSPVVPAIAGILTGKIDLVFRATVDGTARYYVVDYKTTRLCQPRGGGYTDAWLDYAMARDDYYLQSLLYSVALHRYLALRLGDSYAYDTHMGGSLYLYVRGMQGANGSAPVAGHREGVFAQRWPREVVERIDRALSPKRLLRGAR